MKHTDRSSGVAQCVRLIGWALFVMGMTLPFELQAQTYPVKPVRIIVPAAAGGGLDVGGRIIAGKLTDIWSQPVLVENRPGASFIVGTSAVAKSAPDGYTLLYVPSPALTINPLVFPDLPYSPLRDFVPIMLFTTASFVLVVNNSVPANSVQELIAYLRANPGKLNHASNSTSTMLISELFKSLAKVDYMDINYKGGILAVADTISGHTQLCFVDLGSAIAPMQSGLVRALAMTNAQRYKLQPNLPTLAEAGVPGYSAISWNIVLAPAMISQEIVSRIYSDLLRVLASPEVLKRIEANGNEVVGSGTEEALRVLRTDTEKWSRLVKARNIRFQ